MELAKEIMTEPVANQMLQEESLLKDTVINNNLILTSSNEDLNELYENIIAEGYESNTELRGQALEQHYQTILKKRIDGISKDPINYILQTNNYDIADLISELQELKGTSDGAGPVFDSSAEALAISEKNIELASALATEQTKLGIPESQHRFMTNEQATGFVNSYITLAEKSDQKGMQDLMLSLGNDYGLFESKVIAQLKTSGLPEGAEIALSLGNSELAIEALSLDTKEEKDKLKSFLKRETDNETKFDDISIMISEEMKDFEAILRKNVPLDSSGTLPEMEKLIDFLSYAAINRMYGKGMNAEDAAESAANTFMQNFEIEDTYFIPKIYNGEDISSSVDGIIDKANVLKDYYLPEFGAVAFKSATERDEVLLTNKMKSQMQTNGQWRNTPDGEGLVFGIVLANGSFAPVINEKGEELAFKFNDTTYTIPGTSENFDMNLKYNEDVENVYAMGGAIKVDLEPVAAKEPKIFNNPGNIEFGQGYAGQTGEKYAERFAVFDSKEMGVRALAMDLTTKIKRFNGDIEKIITQFAPPNENNTKAYIKFVKRRLKKDKITVNDIAELTKAVIIKENKKSVADLYLIPSIFDVGIQLSKIQLSKGTTLKEALKKLNK